MAGDLTLGVVIALDDGDADAAIIEPRHLMREEQSGVVVWPVAVVEVARNEYQVDLFPKGEIDHRLERAPSGASNLLDRRPRVVR